jgi:tRNA threonylcarbamoyladenosine biosynthesis protein TsaB
LLTTMALILNIDTSTEIAGISLTQDGVSIESKYNKDQKDHASWLHPAIHALMQETGKSFGDLQAVAVTAGPGSYTGLRVGMASAKGLCYALGIPMITANTLAVMALAAQHYIKEKNIDLICPMIDARRMEVFTATYNSMCKEIEAPRALVLDVFSFKELLLNHTVYYPGTGSPKFAAICNSPNAFFGEMPLLADTLGARAEEKFLQLNFTDHNLAEPVYIKEFNSHIKK